MSRQTVGARKQWRKVWHLLFTSCFHPLPWLTWSRCDSSLQWQNLQHHLQKYFEMIQILCFNMVKGWRLNGGFSIYYNCSSFIEEVIFALKINPTCRHYQGLPGSFIHVMKYLQSKNIDSVSVTCWLSKLKKVNSFPLKKFSKLKNCFHLKLLETCIKCWLSSSELINRICGQLVKLQFKCWENESIL